jgi:serine/threonine protein phosphatase PrpC
MNTSQRIVLRAWAASDIGKRKGNEDAFLIDENLGLFLVADGMGGHAKGEVASWFTAESLQNIVTSAKAPSGHMTLDPIGDETWTDDSLLEYAVVTINKKLFDLNEKQREAKSGNSFMPMMRNRGMGTTLVSLLVRGNHVYVTNVGDSRAYRIAQGSIRQLTHDHSWVEEHVRSGEITPEEAKTHKKRNVITRSVGFKPEVEADIDVLTLYPPERFLLCSDGLSNVVNEKDLLELGQSDDLKKACEELVELAVASGGKDNVTAVLVDVRAATDKPDIDEGQFTM